MSHRPKCKIDKCKIENLLEGNIGENLDDLEFGNDILDTTSKAWSMKEIIDKLDFKNKKFWSGKDCHENEKIS